MSLPLLVIAHDQINRNGTITPSISVVARRRLFHNFYYRCSTFFFVESNRRPDNQPTQSAPSPAASCFIEISFLVVSTRSACRHPASCILYPASCSTSTASTATVPALCLCASQVWTLLSERTDGLTEILRRRSRRNLARRPPPHGQGTDPIITPRPCVQVQTAYRVGMRWVRTVCCLPGSAHNGVHSGVGGAESPGRRT